MFGVEADKNVLEVCGYLCMSYVCGYDMYNAGHKTWNP